MAVTVSVAPEHTLPTEAARVSDIELVVPDTFMDSVSFYDEGKDVRMVSPLFLVAGANCEWVEGQRSLPAKVGDYCLGTDQVTYRFKLARVDKTSVDVESIDVIAETPDVTKVTYEEKAFVKYEAKQKQSVATPVVPGTVKKTTSDTEVTVIIGITMFIALVAAIWVIRSWWHP
jgi:hypothetical protein